MVSIRRFDPVPVGTTPFGGAPIGTQVRVGLGEFLAKPPAGTLWHRPGPSDAFTLHAEQRHPVLEPGDVLGVRPGGLIPTPPMGCHYIRIYDDVPEAKKSQAAEMYKLMGPQPAPMFAALPKPRPSLQGAVALSSRIPMFPPADAGKRWFPFLVDGRDLQRFQAVPVPVAA
ncbi:MAG: hypothetical protein RIT81_22835 [Deltaproteobacteria bacterium]